MAIGTWFVIAAHEEDCRNLKQTLYLVFIMHLVNSVETVLNITGFEKRLCTGFWVCMFFIFESVVIVYMQVVYFTAMPSDITMEINCIDEAPMLYFWMMFNILLLYLGSVVVICYFFRGFCQDPELEKEEEAKYEKNRKLYEERKSLKQLMLKNEEETGEDGLTREEQLLVPIQQHMRSLHQLATQAEWDGDLERCDLLLKELKSVQDYHLKTGSMYYPLF